METYNTHGTCAVRINFEVKDNNVYNVQFIGGCRGNTQGVAKLVEGMNIDEVITRLKGIQCRFGTSCPNELAKALEEYKANNQ